MALEDARLRPFHEGLLRLKDLPDRPHTVMAHDRVTQRQQMFGYTTELRSMSQGRAAAAQRATAAAESTFSRTGGSKLSPISVSVRPGQPCRARSALAMAQ